MDGGLLAGRRGGVSLVTSCLAGLPALASLQLEPSWEPPAGKTRRPLLPRQLWHHLSHHAPLPVSGSQRRLSREPGKEGVAAGTAVGRPTEGGPDGSSPWGCTGTPPLPWLLSTAGRWLLLSMSFSEMRCAES